MRLCRQADAARSSCIHDAGTTMRALVDDILDVAKIEHGGFVINPKPTDIAALATRVTKLFEVQARERGIHIGCSVDLPPGEIMVDPDRMTQILFNLVGNALKFTHEGRIDVRLETVAVADRPRFALSVTDTGIGIAPEWQDAVFDMFRQVDQARTRTYGGTGLGLAISRQLARAMGGEISLSSTQGGGSRFTVDLPLEIAEASSDNVLAFTGAADTFGAVIVVAADPLRGAMLATIARRANRPVIMADAAEQLAARGNDIGLTALIDSQASGLAKKLLAEAALTPRRIIVVGAPDDPEVSSNFPQDCVTVVSFARSMIIAALTSDDVTDGGGPALEGLHSEDESANGHREPAAKRKRAAPMSHR